MFWSQLKGPHAIPLVSLELHVIRSQLRSCLGRPNPHSIVSRKINVSQLVPNSRLKFIRCHRMPRKDNQTLFNSILLHFHTIFQLVNLHPISQQQSQLPSVGRIELHLQKFITVLPQINKTLTASNHHPTLHVDNNHPKRRRPASNGKVLSIERQLDRQNLQRTYVSNLKVSS